MIIAVSMTYIMERILAERARLDVLIDVVLGVIRKCLLDSIRMLSLSVRCSIGCHVEVIVCDGT